jgi:hypothetical protein
VLVGFKGREIVPGKWSAAYYDLHDGMFSMTQNDLVVVHADNIWLKNVKFAVQPAGNAEVKRTGVKNVHAYVRGNYIDHDIDFPTDFDEYLTKMGFSPGYYNPKTCESFIDFYSGEPIYTADSVVLINKRIYYRTTK